MTRPAVAPKPAPGWVFLVLALVLAGGTVAIGANTVHTVRRARAERHGTITVSGCLFDKHGAHSDIYHCEGDFVADHDAFRVRGVAFHNAGRLSPGDRVTGLVAGPADRAADTESRWEIGVKLAFALALAAATAGVLYLWRRVRRLAKD